MALWTPAEISTRVWLDASDESTVYPPTATTTWLDKSGNGNNAVDAYSHPSYPQYLNGLKVLAFNNDAMSIAGLSGFSLGAIFLVWNKPASGGDSYQRIFSAGVGGDDYTVNGVYFIPPTTNLGRDIGGPALETYDHRTTSKDYSNFKLGSLNSNASACNYLGHIAEVVIVGAVSDSEVARIEGYLVWKWGLEAGLPVDHPYKTGAPEIPSGGVPIRSFVDMLYGDLIAAHRTYTDMIYSLFFDRRAYADMLYSLRLGAHLDMYYGDCPELRQRTEMPYGNCPVLRRAMVMKYGDLLMLRHSCEMPYSIVKTLTHAMEMRYAIAESELRAFTDMVYDLSVNNPLRVGMVMPYAAEGDGLVRAIGAMVTIGGSAVRTNHLSVEPDWGLYAIPAELHLTKEADFVQVGIGEAVESVIESVTYSLIVDDKRESRSERGSVTFIVTALSPAVLLSAEFSKPLLSESAEGYHGTAHSLVDELVGDLGPVTWNIDDFPVLPYTVFANDEAPLEVIRKIIEPVDAIIQSDPDGTIRIEYAEPDDWQTREPDYYFSFGRNFVSQDVTLIKKPGYNRFLVSGQMASEKRLWAEQQSVSDSLVDVLGFMTPWDYSVPLVLEHSGGDEVATPEYMGVVEELYPAETEEAEEVEFVAGFAQTRRPIYDIPQVEWQREHLGAVTHAEDGRLEAEIKDGDTDGYSLAKLRYLTRYHLWRVRDDQASTIQYLLRRLDDEVSV